MPINISGDCIFRAARQRFRTDVPRAHRAGTFARRALSAFRGTVFSPVFKGGKTGLRYFKICQTYFKISLTCFFSYFREERMWRKQKYYV